MLSSEIGSLNARTIAAPYRQRPLCWWMDEMAMNKAIMIRVSLRNIKLGSQVPVRVNDCYHFGKKKFTGRTANAFRD